MLHLLEGPALRTHYWEDREEKKCSTQRDSNPQPLCYEACALTLAKVSKPGIRDILWEICSSCNNSASYQFPNWMRSINFQFIITSYTKNLFQMQNSLVSNSGCRFSSQHSLFTAQQKLSKKLLIKQSSNKKSFCFSIKSCSLKIISYSAIQTSKKFFIRFSSIVSKYFSAFLWLTLRGDEVSNCGENVL